MDEATVNCVSLLEECTAAFKDVEGLLNVLIDSREDVTVVLRAQGVRMRSHLQHLMTKIRAATDRPPQNPSKNSSHRFSLSHMPEIAEERDRTDSEGTIYTDMSGPITSACVPAAADTDQDSCGDESYQEMGCIEKKEEKAVDKTSAITRSASMSSGDCYLRPSDARTLLDTYNAVTDSQKAPSEHGVFSNPTTAHSRTKTVAQPSAFAPISPKAEKRSRSLSSTPLMSPDFSASLEGEEAIFAMRNMRKRSASGFAQPQCTGYLEKRGGLGGRSWQKRYFVLDCGCLYFYMSPSDEQQRNQLLVSLYETSHDQEHSTKKRPSFKMVPLRCGGKEKAVKMYCFRTNDETDLSRWMKALHAAAGKTVNRQTVSVPDLPVEPDEEGTEQQISMDDEDLFEEGGDYYDRPDTVRQNRTEEDSRESGTYPSVRIPPGNGLAQKAANNSHPSTAVSTKVTKGPVPAPSPSLLGSKTENGHRGAQAPVAPARRDMVGKKRNGIDTDDLAPLDKDADQPPPLPEVTSPKGRNKTAMFSNFQESPKTSTSDAPGANTTPGIGQLSPNRKPRAGLGKVLPMPEEPLFVDTLSIFLQLPDKPLYDDIYVALWNYQATVSDELSFQRGDLIWVENRDVDPNKSWWVGRKQSMGENAFNGDRGLFISAYVESAYERLE